MELLGSKDVEIRRLTIRFVGDLITKSRTENNLLNSEAFFNANGIPATIQLFEDEDQHVKSMGMGVLRVLAGGTQKELFI